MSALIWEFKSDSTNFYQPLKLRIRRDDNSQISGIDVDGDKLFNACENGVGTLGVKNIFGASFGFGYRAGGTNFYDKFFQAAEEYNPNQFRALGNGIGATLWNLPYRREPNVQDEPNMVDSIEWEDYNYSIIVTLNNDLVYKFKSDQFVHFEPPIHPNALNQAQKNQQLENFPYLNIKPDGYDEFWGKADDTSENFSENGGEDSFSYQRKTLFGHTILMTFSFEIYNINVIYTPPLVSGGGQGSYSNEYIPTLNKKIQCADTSPLTSGESPMTNVVNTNDVKPPHESPILYAPIKFTEFVKNFDLGIAELDLTPVVIEGQDIEGTLRISSSYYAGDFNVYIVDKNQENLISQLNVDEGFLNFNGELTDDNIVNYGRVEVGGQYSDDSGIYTFNIEAGETKEIPVKFFADSFTNPQGGQVDSFNIFVKTTNPNFQAMSEATFASYDFFGFTFEYQDSVEDIENSWEALEDSGKWSFSNTNTIKIINIFDESEVDYNPSDNLIEKPADIVYHILENELGYDAGNLERIDQLSLEESRIINQQYRMAFSVNKKIKSKKLIEEIMQSSQSVATLSNDMLKFINIKNNYTGNENIQTVKHDEVLGYNFTRTPLEDVITQIEIKYNYDYGLDNFSQSTGLIKINEDYLRNAYFINGTYKELVEGKFNLGANTKNYYGLKITQTQSQNFANIIDKSLDYIDSFLTLENKYIRDAQTANELAKFLLLWNCNQHNIVELSLPLKYYGLQIGDLIEFDEMILGKKVYNEDYVVKNPDDMPIRCGQFILPLFMITETQKGLDKVKIKATQLHHMQNESFSYKGQTYSINLADFIEPVAGDVTLSSDVSVSDIVLMVSHILGTNILTGQALTNGDMNGDGEINIGDVVLVVNQILGVDNE
tara:strand:- start:9800 stop:12463 length:2664 start_codon:yes stop_codon:yes gene_type:complete